MIELFLGAAAFAAVLAFVARTVRSTLVERRRPGRSPGRALPVEDYSDIDAAVRMEVCTCTSHFVLRGEGPLQHGERQLRAARIECRSCGRERVLYFDLSGLRQGHAN